MHFVGDPFFCTSWRRVGALVANSTRRLQESSSEIPFVTCRLRKSEPFFSKTLAMDIALVAVLSASMHSRTTAFPSGDLSIGTILAAISSFSTGSPNTASWVASTN